MTSAQDTAAEPPPAAAVSDEPETMKSHTGTFTLIAAFYRAGLPAAPVAATEEPTVDGVLEKYANAIGGKDAWNKVESRLIRADFEDLLGSISEWSLRAKAPDKRLTRMESSPWGVLLAGLFGDGSWAPQPCTWSNKPPEGTTTRTAPSP